MRNLLALSAVILSAAASAQAQSAEACGVCHSGIHSQWQQSTHAGSWRSPLFLSQVQAVGKPEFCAACHAPLSVWQEVNLKPETTALTPGASGAADAAQLEFQALLALIPIPRKELFEDGVNCAACHSVPVYSPVGRGEEFVGPFHATEGHGGKPAEGFSDLRLCSACHGGDPAHFLPEGANLPPDYYHLAAVPVRFEVGSSDCNGCHMPRKTARVVQLRTFRHLPQREVGNHGFGNQRWEGLADALAFEVSGTALKITNQKVGHPLQINPHHKYSLQVVALRGGQEVGRHEQPVLSPGELGMGEALDVSLPFSVESGDSVTIRMSLAKSDQPVRVVLEKKL
jgi:hypothetical protein